MPSAVESIFDIAFWFSDTALNQNEYLQPQKLHRLMFLSQAYFSVAYGGKKLMPAVFIADDLGPIEPNVYKAFAKGRPDIDVDLFMPEEVEAFLESIWRRFGHLSPERLSQMTKETQAYTQAYKKGRRTEIAHQAIRLSFTRGRETPAVDQVVKPKVMRLQSGKPVAVKGWKPKAAKPDPQAADPQAADPQAADKQPRAWNPGEKSANKTAEKKSGGKPWPKAGMTGGRPWPPSGKRVRDE